MGRFANQLFQVAGIIGIATKNGQPFSFPKWENTDHKERFGSTEDIEIYKYLENELPVTPMELNYQYRWIDWGFHDIHIPAGSWDLCGHFQSWKYFDHCMDLVRRHLRMKGEPEQMEYVAVHYRAGDYIDDPLAYHPRMPENYYIEAVKHFPENTMFRLFSDDLDAFHKIFSKTGRPNFSFTGNDYIGDWIMMKRCKGFIISNSSYSAMAALLGEHPEKKVVSPSGYNWFGDVAGINGNDIMHPSWVQIKFEKTREAKIIHN